MSMYKIPPNASREEQEYVADLIRDEARLPSRGSGAPSEAYYEQRGVERLQLRLPADTVAILNNLAAERGLSRASLIVELVDEAGQQYAKRLACADASQLP